MVSNLKTSRGMTPNIPALICLYDVVHEHTGPIRIYTNFAYVMSSSNVSMFNVDCWGPFYHQGLILMPVWISNYIHDKVWDEIPFSNFKGTAVEA